VKEGLRTIFANLPAEEIARAAAAALGVADARPESVDFEEIRKPHADPRTIGIVRVSGWAVVNGERRAWSSVTKLIDILVPNTLGTPVDPGTEVKIYERGYFAHDGGRMRPARCYHISRPRPGLTILWLEDLTDAEGAPFGLNQLAEMAEHLGEWNARTALNPPQLDFPIGSDFQTKSTEGFDFPRRLPILFGLSDEPMVRQMYARHSLELAERYVWTFLSLIERSTALPHVLSLADCPVSNFFHRPGETIAIDWAGLGSEPLGADGGRFLGSSLTWGRQFADVAVHERDLFEAYLKGLRLGGLVEDRSIIRLGYLTELAFYLCTTSMLPELVHNPHSTLSVDFFEKRLDMPVAEFGRAAAPVIDLLPSYIEEIRSLMGS
jgi:hypothetical protein